MFFVNIIIILPILLILLHDMCNIKSEYVTKRRFGNHQLQENLKELTMYKLRAVREGFK